MAREKNISIQHYVNTRLKGWENEDGTKSYPLYTQVVYGRESTKFKTTMDGFLPHGTTIHIWEKDADKIKEGIFPEEKMKKRVLKKDRIIQKIAEYEIEKYGEDFKLKGLGKRIKIYDSYVKDIISDRIYFEFTEFLGANVTHKEYISIIGHSPKFEKQLEKLFELKPNLFNDASLKLKAWTGLVFLLKNFAEHRKTKDVTCYEWLLIPNTKSAFAEATSKFMNSKKLNPQPEIQFEKKDMNSIIRDIDITIEVYIKLQRWVH